MKAFAKIVDEKLKTVQVGLDNSIDAINLYKSIGMEEMDVEQGYDANWYLEGYVPAKPEPTLQEQLLELEEKYNMPRVIREGILGNPTMYSEFNVNRARELEDIADKIRKSQGGN